MEQKLAAGLAAWLTGELERFGASYGGDHGVAEYLLSIESDADLAAYLNSFLGETHEVQELCNELIRRRQALGGPAAAVAARHDAGAPSAGAAAKPPAAGGFYMKDREDEEPRAPPQAKKKKGKQGGADAAPGSESPEKKKAGLSQEDVERARAEAEPEARSRFGGVVVAKGRKGGKGKPLDAADLAHGILLPGRRRCDCMATRHRLVGNCVSCGKIVCEQEGEGSCLFCAELRAAAGESNALAETAAEGSKKKGSKKAELRAAAFMGSAEPKRVAGKAAPGPGAAGAAAERAVEQKDRLVGFDRSAAQRTVIIDDQTDWYDTRWMSRAERDASLAAAAEEKRRAEEAGRRRREVKLTFDLAGRRARVLVDDDGAGEGGEGGPGDDEGPRQEGSALVRTVTKAGEAGSARLRETAPRKDGGTGLFANPFLAVPAPRFVPSDAKPKPKGDDGKKRGDEKALQAAAAFREGHKELSRGMTNVRPFDENARRVLERVQHDELLALSRPPALADLDAEPAPRGGEEEEEAFWSPNYAPRVDEGAFSVPEEAGGVTEDGVCARGPRGAARDEGAALSMHQPWASLLVMGIKRVEGRGWPTKHRGRLWIAATVKEPDPQEVKEVEGYYAALARRLGRLPPAFPAAYPTAALLGCVDVVDCVSHEEWVEALAAGAHAEWPEENESRYVFVCRNPQRLPVPFPVRGQHKIWRLEGRAWEQARRALA